MTSAKKKLQGSKREQGIHACMLTFLTEYSGNVPMRRQVNR